MVNYTFPRVQFNVQDNSTAVTSNITQVTQSRHVPFFFITAAKGRVNEPFLCSIASAITEFGADTFNPTKPYFTHQTIFALKAMDYQQVYLVRLVDNTAVAASVVLLCSVTPAEITQYELNASGERVLDSNGNPIPLTGAGGAVTQAPGFNLVWSTRALNAGEVATAVATTTTVSNSVTTTTYPILVAEANHVGAGSNLSGFQFYYDPSVSTTEENTLDSSLYSFSPVTVPSGLSTTSTVQDIYGALVNPVSLKTSAVDPNTSLDYSLNGIQFNNYNGLLDYEITTYSANVSTIGALLLPVEGSLTGVTDPFLANIVAGIDQNGNPYTHTTVTNAMLNSSTFIRLSGGTDGTIGATAFENLVTTFVQGGQTSMFTDNLRFPFTNGYDSGFAMSTKIAMISSLYALRDDISIDWSTQDLTQPINTPAQDQSSGSAILSRIQTTPESVLFGTPAMRGAIYQQMGWLATANGYMPPVPTVMWRMLSRCIFMSGPTITGAPKGRPRSEVSIFKKVSWTASSVTQKELNWDTCLNTIAYADQNTLFYPDLKSVYSDDTSLLSDSVFVDYLVTIKHIGRERWTYWVGVEDAPTKLFDAIAQDIDQQISYVFRGLLSSKTTVYQTAADQNAGDQITVNIAVTGNKPCRTWNVILAVSANTPAAATTSTVTSTTVSS